MLAAALALLTLAPPDTLRYDVLNHGRRAGEMRVIRSDTSVVIHYHHIDRNRGRRAETRYRMDGDLILAGETWQLPLDGPVGDRPASSDRFERAGDTFRWRAGDSTRTAPATAASFYRLGNATPYDLGLLARFALRQPDRTARLVNAPAPGRVEVIADTVLPLRAGPQRVRLAAVHTGGRNPAAVWLDGDDRFFASSVGWFITVPRGREDALPAQRARRGPGARGRPRAGPRRGDRQRGPVRQRARRAGPPHHGRDRGRADHRRWTGGRHGDTGGGPGH
jgi:hypothetical protein